MGSSAIGQVSNGKFILQGALATIEWMKGIMYASVFLVQTTCSYAQTGTIGDPFTSLQQGADVMMAGVYYFDIGGTTFDTFVDANGYVQVAIDFGNGVGVLPQGTSLNNTTRGILNTAILGALTETQEVRISSSTGNLDVTTTDATIISRIQSNTTLHQGTADNLINSNWAGTNAIYITVNSSCITVDGTSLHENIIHVCGNVAGFHWIPSSSFQAEQFSSGEVANSTFFQLWVRSNLTLPIELVTFSATITHNKRVRLDWETASEKNNDYFTVERTIDGINWEIIKHVDGAGDSSTPLNYSEIDNNPYPGISYYRLKQTDFDGQFSYSKMISINFQEFREARVSVYPNPVNNKLTIQGDKPELEDIQVYDVFGQNVTGFTRQETSFENRVVIDLSRLNVGVYYIKSKTTTNRICKVH